MTAPVTSAHAVADADIVARLPLPGPACPEARRMIAQAIADAETRGREHCEDAHRYCPECGAELDDWRGHRTDPPCRYDTDTDDAEETTTA